MGAHGDRHANASGSQRVGSDFRPGLAFVERLVELGVAGNLGGRSRAATRGEPPRLRFGGCKNHVGFVKGRREIAAAGLIVRVQHVSPSLAAVVRTENAAFRAGRAAHGDNNHDIGIFGINNDLRDLGCTFEADVRPGAAGIRGLVHPVTVGAGGGARHCVAAPRINDVGIRGSDLDGADAIHVRHLVKYRIPGHTAAGRFPNSALRQADIKSAGLADNASDGRDTSAVIRTHVAPLQAGKQIRTDLCRRAEREAEHNSQRYPKAIRAPRVLNHCMPPH